MQQSSSQSDPTPTTTEDQDTGEIQSGPAGDGELGESQEDDTQALPLDQVFEILKNKRRRETLHYLRDNDGEATLSDLAEHIAAIENDTTVRAITSSQRKRVYVGLYQCHLPKMDDMDIIDFDQNRGTIEAGANIGQLEEYLAEPETRDWHRAYLAISAAGVGLFVASQLGAVQYGLTPAVVLVGLLVGITGCAIAQTGILSDIRP